MKNYESYTKKRIALEKRYNKKIAQAEKVRKRYNGKIYSLRFELNKKLNELHRRHL